MDLADLLVHFGHDVFDLLDAEVDTRLAHGVGGGLEGEHDLLVELAGADGVELGVDEVEAVAQTLEALDDPPALREPAARRGEVALLLFGDGLVCEARCEALEVALPVFHVAAALFETLLGCDDFLLWGLGHDASAAAQPDAGHGFQEAVHDTKGVEPVVRG